MAAVVTVTHPTPADGTFSAPGSAAWDEPHAVSNAVANQSTNGSISLKDAALATTATTGFLMIPSMAGVPTGVPASIPTGQTPVTFDNVGLDLYGYLGGAWTPSSPGVDTANSPAANEFARFTDADTIEGRTTTEVKSDLGLVIGTNVQAWAANLDEYAAVNPTAAGLAILDDADGTAQLATIAGASATGSGGVVRATSPTLVTPVLGAATATSVVVPTVNGGTAANDDITIQGTSNATRTTSYVVLQPTAGNVGIGDTAPTEKLVIGDGVSNFDFSMRTSTGNRAFLTGYADSAIFAVNRKISDGVFANTALAAASITLASGNADSSITFATAAANNTFQTTRLTIDKNGLATFTQDVVVPDEAYDATGWNGSLEVPTKNAVRDKIEAIPALTDGDKGDITVSASGATWTVDAAVVTLAKMANLAQDQFIGRTTASTGVPETATITAAARTVLDDTTVAEMVATLGAQPSLPLVTAGADAAPAMAVNTFYLCDISGYTADRTATLPGTAAVGDRIGIFLTEGDTAFELLITATAGDTLNGIAGGTEWSRLFIKNELVILRCIVANTTWIVEQDGRIPMKALLRLSTSTNATESADTWYHPTDRSGVWTADVDVGGVTATATGRITARRACYGAACLSGYLLTALSDTYAFIIGAEKTGSGVSVILASQASPSTSPSQFPIVTAGVSSIALAADDYLRWRYQSTQGTRGVLGNAGNYNIISFAETF